jgi:hypothetical protein
VQAVPIGEAKRYGQAFDEPHRRTVCVSICEGVSSASGLAIAARDERAACSCC